MATLFMGTSQWIIDPSGANITINRDQQGEDAVVEPMLTTQPLMSLASSDPSDYIQTAVGMKATLTIADIDLKNQILALCTSTTVVTNTTKKKVVAKDLAGTKSVPKKIIIKPYDGLLPSTDANSWITIPRAIITDLQGASLAFGIKTQQMIKISFQSTPDNDGVKFILGDETA